MQSDRFQSAFNYLSADLSFKALLKKHCEQGGKTRYDAIAAAADLDIAYVYRLVAGEKVHPSPNTVIRLALALHLSLSDTDELLLAAGYAPLVIPRR